MKKDFTSSNSQKKHAKFNFIQCKDNPTQQAFIIPQQYINSSSTQFLSTKKSGAKTVYSSGRMKKNLQSTTPPPIFRSSSPFSPQRRSYHQRYKSNSIIQQNQDESNAHDNPHQTNIQKRINSLIFKRRSKSEEKFGQKNQEKPLQVASIIDSNQNQRKCKINFANKIIDDLKRDTSFALAHRTSRSQSRSKQKEPFFRKFLASDLSNDSNSSTPKNRYHQKGQRQKSISSSLQKLKSSFTSNEIRLSLKSNKKKSVLTFNNSSKQFNVKKVNLRDSRNTNFDVERIFQQTNQLQQTQEKTQENQYENFLKPILKDSQNIKDYLIYIHGNLQTEKYVLNLQYLSLLKKRAKQELFQTSTFDLGILRLIQSLYLCIADILKTKPQEINFEILREYAIVYFQAYNKIKIEYACLEILFSSSKTKLFKLFLFQRIFFSLLLEMCLKKNTKISYIELSTLTQCLSLCEQMHTTIVNMLFEQLNNNSDHSIIDTFKTLRLTRELDKRIPTLQGIYKQIQNVARIKNQKHPKQKQTQFFPKVFQCYQAFFRQLQRGIVEYQNVCIVQMYFSWKYFMTPPLFYLPSNQSISSKPYTLIIDLGCTLVFYNEQTRILKYRPYMDKFLFSMQNYFEIILFSSNAKQRTDIIAKQIERDNRIFRYRLYKSHMVFQQGCLRKNISFTGLNMARTVFIDDEQKNVSLYPQNCYKIKPFLGDKQDKQLLHITDWLSAIMQDKPFDVRNKLKKPQNYLQSIEEVEQNCSTIHRSIQQEI